VSNATLTPLSPVAPGWFSRAVTVATASPDSSSASRDRRSTLASSTICSLILLRSMCWAPIEPPPVGGIIHRLCGPPGPLKLPRLSISHSPVYARRGGTPNGLL
jgi:hypothetical protein